ncbi:MAG: hypothetical protein H6620_05350 [Halobacteriovoraceae bacterium]|nr:hypothetical protein [Halobacteriovoraceae bacterium]
MKKVLPFIFLSICFSTYASVKNCRRYNPSTNKFLGNISSDKILKNSNETTINGCDEKVILIEIYPDQDGPDLEAYYFNSYDGDSKECIYSDLNKSVSESLFCKRN